MIEYSGEVIGVSGIIIGIFIAVFFYLRSRKVKRLSFGMRKIEVLTKKRDVPDLKISFENKLVERLSLTRVAIYNDGNQVIDASDIAKIDPLRIVIPEGFRIFNAGFFFVRNEANNFSLEENREEGVIWVNFDYMNEGDGCVVEIFNDIDEFNDISVTGSIKGIKLIQKKILVRSDLRMYLDFICLFFGIGIALWISPSAYYLFPAIACVYALMFLLDKFLKRKLPIPHTEFFLEKVYAEEL